MDMQKILLLKETRAGESRVALVPKDVAKLTQLGAEVFVEQGAGIAAGFTDQQYTEVGAIIRELGECSVAGFKNLFSDINIVVRAKRANRAREIAENQALHSGMYMIGALDPYELPGDHIKEYRQAGIHINSIDQLDVPSGDPRNLLHAMSAIAGKLALQDALVKFQGSAQKVVLLGFGVVGQAALQEALTQGLSVDVLLPNARKSSLVIKQGGKPIVFDGMADLYKQQQEICQYLMHANIIISSARQANVKAPLLIPNQTLALLTAGTVIIDMAISEGGNVEGSQHDQAILLGNEVVVANVSGYPKAIPHEASILWSGVSFHVLKDMISENNDL